MKRLCAIAAALLIGMTAAEAGEFQPNPDAVCPEGKWSLDKISKDHDTVGLTKPKVFTQKPVVEAIVKFAKTMPGADNYNFDDIVLIAIAANVMDPTRVSIGYFGEDECVRSVSVNVPMDTLIEVVKKAGEDA